jgi:hypothetical protein
VKIKAALLLLILSGLISLPVAAEDDVWVGRYRAAWMEGSPGTDGELSIAKAPKADRWLLSSPSDKRVIELRPFLPNEYQGLQTEGTAECLNGDNFAVCRVKPGSTISFDGGGPVPEKLVVSTGYFGILIRNEAAGFQLTKLSSTS